MILVTGSNGFVGRALCERLGRDGLAVRGAVRGGARAGQVNVGNLDGNTDWEAALDGCDTVLHCAARVHVMADAEIDPLRAYREVNVEATVHLARRALAHGLRRFVFVSSVKVNGEITHEQPFRADDVPAPADPYGVSKLEAEQALLALGRETGLEIVIVRPPLVYGPGVKANFLNLVRLVQRGIPLPFGSLRNRRSMVALDNLVDLLVLCTRHPAAAGRVWMVSDGADLTIGELVRLIADAQQSRQWLLPLPAGLMRAAAGALGKSAVASRLLDSLQVDIAATREVLGWTPPMTPREAVGMTVAALAAQDHAS